MNLEARIQLAKSNGSQRLNLSCGLKEFPPEIYALADTLEVLDLSGNQLSSLPDDFHRLRKLRILFCSDNQFTELPEVIGQCPQLSMVGFKANKIRSVPAAALGKSLRWLILTDNQITELPPEIGLCTQLQKLMLSGNRLQNLPDAMSACTRLELLRIAANRLSELPDWLLQLPRLSWLAYAGNPFSEVHETRAREENPIDEIHWQQLELQNRLGEGASGVIHQATWNPATGESRNVAVKLFKGAITSDGLPYSEKTACISAGAHPNLIAVHGRIVGHPSAHMGLIMALIDGGFHNLANPPSLESCTRDIYDSGIKFTLKAALDIAHGIASAAKQLHDKGIMHGDLYAHNILHNGKGDCLLGDFGAASFYSPQDKSRAEALQRIEVRAFGCLLEELIERCTTVGEDRDILKSLQSLQANCTQDKNTARPLFNGVLKILKEQIHRMHGTPCDETIWN